MERSDQKDPSVLQKSLVSMFKWYEGSVVTIIFLCNVDQLAELGTPIIGKWNSRRWALQEYRIKGSPNILQGLVTQDHFGDGEGNGDLRAILDGTPPWVQRHTIEASYSFNSTDDTGRGCGLFATWNFLNDLSSHIWRGRQGPGVTLVPATRELGGHKHPCIEWEFWKLQ